jgi:hypothetical protein
MAHQNKVLSSLLQGLDLGYSIAEEDTLLEAARIETSAFTDLLNDRVDLIPGTKGSGKSALFRIFVDFLPNYLLEQRKVVVAGTQIKKFQLACSSAKIPEIQAKKSLRDILEWSLHVLASWRPKLKYQPPGDVGELELDLFG